ncbi:MAG: hypothetical protein ACTHK4_04345 [Mycobacteriales bacterium]
MERSWGRDRLYLAGLAVLAFAVRLTPVLLHGGLGFIGRYDDGVYYSAADALSFGRVPYKDFVLLHPPGIMLVLLPFAALGRVTTDLTGVEAARVAFMALGAVNTVLVAKLASRWGRPAMLAAGLIYACWQPAVYAEQSTFLEPVGGLLVLCALYRLVKVDRPPTLRSDLVCGLLLGAAVTVKIWYVAPVAVIVAWQLVARRPKSAARMVVAAVACVAVIVTPFAVLAGRPMAAMVLRDQLFRPVAVPSRMARVTRLSGIRTLVPHNLELRHALIPLIAVMFVVVVAAALRDRATWPLFAILAVNVTVLIASPLFLRHYSSYIAAPGALLVGIGVGELFQRARLRVIAPAFATSLVIACAFSAIAIAQVDGGRAFPGKQFAAATPAGCIAADDPLALAEIDRLSTDLGGGCRVDIDVSGVVLDRFKVVGANGVLVARRDNVGWQQYLYRYLTASRAFIICREPQDGITGPFLRSYDRFPLVISGVDGHDDIRLGRDLRS